MQIVVGDIAIKSAQDYPTVYQRLYQIPVWLDASTYHSSSAYVYLSVYFRVCKNEERTQKIQ